MASSSSSPFSRARLTATLTSVQHASALVFGSFLFVHLAAPSTAVLASHGNGTDLATKTMILGRVYYQNVVTEPTIVYGAAVVHVLSGLAKRAMNAYARFSRRKEKNVAEPYRVDSISEPSPTSWHHSLTAYLPSVHTATGLLLAPALAIHVALNRLAPSRDAAPINGLSPSELDYSFVTYGLEKERARPWRLITLGMYALLLGAGSVHVVSGTDRIAQRARARRVRKRASADGDGAGDGLKSAATGRRAARDVDVRRRRMRKNVVTALVSAAGASWLAIGIAKMVSEGGGASGYMAKRIDACYASVWPYSHFTHTR